MVCLCQKRRGSQAVARCKHAHVGWGLTGAHRRGPLRCPLLLRHVVRDLRGVGPAACRAEDGAACP